MAIKVTEQDLWDLTQHAQQQGEGVYYKTEFSERYKMVKQLGQGEGSYTITLRGGLTIQILDGQFRKPFVIQKSHDSTFPVTAKFFLSGVCRVKTNGVSEIATDYEEVAGCNYLYHLPDLIESEEYPPDTSIRMVLIWAKTDYFRTLNLLDRALPHPLSRLMQGSGRFHQPLGKTTLAMTQALHQILHCPYQGSTQHLYLESKALELLTLQFASLDASSTVQQSPIKAADLERVQHARDILVQGLCNSLSMTELSRKVGLNECTLKRGFRHLFGTTVFGYLRNYRMEQAQHLLRQPNVTVAQVAAQVGYRNPEAFSTAFRRQFSVSPKAYQLGRCS